MTNMNISREISRPYQIQENKRSIKNCLFKLEILLHLDCDEEFIVEDGKECKGEEDHSKEIGNEDVIPENHYWENSDEYTISESYHQENLYEDVITRLL